MQPTKGTITARVWEVADSLSSEQTPARRDDVIHACVHEGINGNTASTQYSVWKANRWPEHVRPRRPSTTPDAALNSDPLPDAPDWHDLLKGGFAYIADWKLDETDRIVLDRDVGSDSGVYAFVLDDEVTYIGVTLGPLSKRLYGYSLPGPTQRTNIRLNAMIQEALAEGHALRVLFASPEPVTWRSWPVETSLDLERGLIGLFRPRWNILASG